MTTDESYNPDVFRVALPVLEQPAGEGFLFDHGYKEIDVPPPPPPPPLERLAEAANDLTEFEEFRKKRETRRQKNRGFAMQSRQRKKAHMEGLETQARELTTENERLTYALRETKAMAEETRVALEVQASELIQDNHRLACRLRETEARVKELEGLTCLIGETLEKMKELDDATRAVRDTRAELEERTHELTLENELLTCALRDTEARVKELEEEAEAIASMRDAAPERPPLPPALYTCSWDSDDPLSSSSDNEEEEEEGERWARRLLPCDECVPSSSCSDTSGTEGRDDWEGASGPGSPSSPTTPRKRKQRSKVVATLRREIQWLDASWDLYRERNEPTIASMLPHARARQQGKAARRRKRRSGDTCT